MQEIIAVETLWIGKSPDVEGVAVIINAGMESQLILAVPDNIAVNGGQELRNRGLEVPLPSADQRVQRQRPILLDG